MILTLLLISSLALTGSVLTYLYSDEDSLPVRLAAGNIISSVLFGLVAFLVGCAFGLTTFTVTLSLLISFLPLALLARKDLRGKFLASFKRSPEINSKSSLNALYYLAFLVLFYFFFARGMYETPEGIFTGSPNNLGDLSVHLGAIFGFTEGQNLPPENPSYAFTKFTYPFMVDLIVACFVKLGAKVGDAMLWQSITLAISLVVLLENFARRLTRNRLAGKLTPLLLMFCGGLGFVFFLRDYWLDGRRLFEFIWYLPYDYTIREGGFRWGNSLTTLFITQRTLLLGMPLTLIILTHLREVFTTDEENEKIQKKGEDQAPTTGGGRQPILSFPASSFFIGLIAGTLPLVHVHSLAVLFGVTACLFFFRMDKRRVWLAFGAGVCVVAVPEFCWMMTGSATHLRSFIGWGIGWDRRGENVLSFWVKNLGLFIPLLILAFWRLYRAETEEIRAQNERQGTRGGGQNIEERRPKTRESVKQLFLFYIPFLLIFIIANLFRIAPWVWDNIKVLIYWFVASAPVVAWLLARLWERGGAFYRFVSAACLMVLIFSGALNVWRVLTKHMNYQVFSRDGVRIAEQIKEKTSPNALFLNAPIFNSAVVLSGRRSLMRFAGHLGSWGIHYAPRESEVKGIYEGSPLADAFLEKNGIEYVLLSPEEKGNLTVNEGFFSKYPVIAESGEYRVYQIKK